jgi:hypothetical protein
MVALSIVLAGVLLGGCLLVDHSRVQRAMEVAGAQESGTRAVWVRGGLTSSERAFIAQPDGQWAVSATASSTYADVHGVEASSPMQVTGAPDTSSFAADDRAWRPLLENGGYEWLELTYARAVHARSVRIREVHGCGTVVMVQLKDADGNYHVKWKGHDRPNMFITWLALDFPPTQYLVNGVKVTLDTTLVSHWKHFDAVQLVGSQP